MNAFDEYERALEPARRAFDELEAVRAVVGGELSPRAQLAFLLEWCALGVKMTEPVEGWIRRAGERCLTLGHAELGRMLVVHAGHEAGHDALFRRDVARLAARARTVGLREVAPEALVGQLAPAGVRAYRELHERTIEGPAPFAQLAIETEIEALSVRTGPRLLGACARLLGEDVLSDLSFATEHVAVDEGHTRLNRETLARFLDEHPAALPALVEAGTRALAAYGAFVGDCLALAVDLEEGRGPVTWSLVRDPSPGFLSELSAMRGSVLHDGGTRPAFVAPDGTPRDVSGADAASWHLVARCQGRIVACARAAMLDAGPSAVEEEFGVDAVAAAIRELGIDRARTGEAGRLLVDRRFRSREHGLYAFAAVWLACVAQGMERCFAIAGQREQQARFFTSMGAARVACVSARRVEAWNDEIELLCFDTAAPSPELRPLLAEAGAALGLPVP